MKRFLLTIFLSFATASHAEITELTRMEGILTKIDDQSLVVFDIDNTLIQPTQMLGSDQWFSYLVNRNEAAGLSKDDAVDRAISVWKQVQLRTSVRTVEKTTPQIIRSIQQRGIRVMALTARPTELAAASLRQLSSVGINLKTSHRFGNTDIVVSGENQSLFSGGILFVGPKNNKGSVLAKFLKIEKYKPRSVVFIDDKEKHVINVGQVVQELDISYRGFRYGAADKYVAAFDPVVAEIQYRHFLSTSRFLSDLEAKPRHPIQHLKCIDRRTRGDYNLEIFQEGNGTYSIGFVVNLDVPGGHYERNGYSGLGTLDESGVNIDVWSGKSRIGKVAGNPSLVRFENIEFACVP